MINRVYKMDEQYIDTFSFENNSRNTTVYIQRKTVAYSYFILETV